MSSAILIVSLNSFSRKEGRSGLKCCNERLMSLEITLLANEEKHVFYGASAGTVKASLSCSAILIFSLLFKYDEIETFEK